MSDASIHLRSGKHKAMGTTGPAGHLLQTSPTYVSRDVWLSTQGFTLLEIFLWAINQQLVDLPTAILFFYG